MADTKEEIYNYLEAVKDRAKGMFDRQTSLEPQQSDFLSYDTLGDVAVGLLPGMNLPVAARDFERARREGSTLGMAGAAVGALPLGNILKKGGGLFSRVWQGPKGTTDPELAKKWVAAAQADDAGLPLPEGFVKGADGKLRYWVDDAAADLDMEKVTSNAVPLSSVMSHPELEKLYKGQLEGVNIRYFTPDEVNMMLNQGITSPKGKYLASTNTIILQPGISGEEAARAALHEYQHHIQNINQFFPGGNRRRIEKDFQDMQRAAQSNPLAKRKYDQFAEKAISEAYPDQKALYLEMLRSNNPEAQKEVYHALYEALHGEKEARAVEMMRSLSKKRGYDPSTAAQKYKEATSTGLTPGDTRTFADDLMKSPFDSEF